MRRRAAAGVGLALAVSAAGCGLGTGRGPAGVSLTVTRDFGSRSLGSVASRQAPGGETVMRFLQRRFQVQTRYGGGFVQAIDGLAGGLERGRRIDWFYYVNGVQAATGAAATLLHPGDRIWWDRHDWGAAMSVPAVVGSFPEPFRAGVEGRRLPVTVACAPGAVAACEEVTRRLAAAGARAGMAVLGSGSTRQTLRVLVGPWRELRREPAARRLEGGPASSGVFARPDGAGRRIVLLDERGRPARSLERGGGLVAATRLVDQQPTWLVTGTDTAGVAAAARLLDERALAHRFALAVAGRRRVALPMAAGA